MQNDCPMRESNTRPFAYEANALPTKLTGQMIGMPVVNFINKKSFCSFIAIRSAFKTKRIFLNKCQGNSNKSIAFNNASSFLNVLNLEIIQMICTGP